VKRAFFYNEKGKGLCLKEDGYAGYFNETQTVADNHAAAFVS
jgi:hypothetical protein